jgi:DNA polymerase III epsilon subunit-like protein
MLVAWIDTETSGINPIDSAAFEIAVLVYDGSDLLAEREWHLNPFNDDKVLYHQDAYKVHGVKEETIKSYPPAETVMPELSDWLTQWAYTTQYKYGVPDRRFVFAGYCAGFDYGHVKALFDRCGINMDFHFDGRIIDVYALVKKAYAKGIIKYTPNKKLETITKALGIPHEGAHSARSDIWATRKLYETIWAKERKMQ